MAKLRPIPHFTVPLVDQSGRINEAWYLYFLSREKAALANLSDVSATAPTDGQLLTYSAANGAWEPA